MAYCTVEDMMKLLPESMLVSLSSDQPGDTMVDQDNIDEAIDQADREIDAYLFIAGQSVPMDPVPPLVANLSTKMAIWNLHLRKYFASAVWQETYNRCLKLLEKIAEGKLSVGQIESGITETSEINKSGTWTRTQKFTEDFMDEF
jgi:phage gp36-like protein